MTHASDLLHQLGMNTTYAELHQLFAQLAAETAWGRVDEQLAAKIDGMIDQLIRERAHDEKELRDVQSQYESFREQNRGFVGWIKRHIPFTETRRQELNHQGEVADQSAEVLADNLIIARAQMLKERILPLERRRLGKRTDEWQRQWELNRPQPAAAARLLGELHREIDTSKAFVAEVKNDIRAFADAKFRDKADNERRDADVAAAQQELETLNQEIQGEEALKKSALGILATDVATELESTDPQFKADKQDLQRLETTLSRLNESRTSLAKLVATVGQIAEANKQLQVLPDQLRQVRHAVAHITGERAGALQMVTAKKQAIHERESRHAELQKDVDQAKKMLASLQPTYDAYLAQRAASSMMPQAVEAEPPAPIVQQYQAARDLVDQAHKRLQESAAALDAIRREASQAESNVKGVEDKIAAEQKKLAELEKKEPQLRAELSNHMDRGQHDFAAAAATLGAYLQLGSFDDLPPYRPLEIGAGTSGFLGHRGLEIAFANGLFQSHQNPTRYAQASNTLERLVQWQNSHLQHIESQRVQLRSRRDSIWKRRCTELLGQSLAEEACQAGLGSV